MAFYWQHQVGNTFSPVFDSPLELLNYQDTYFEDYAYRIRTEQPNAYSGFVQTVGVRHCHPNYHFLNRISERYSLHYVLSGKGWVGNQEVGPGDIFFFDRNQIHNFSTDNQEPCNYAWITFKGPGCSQLLLQSGFHGNMIFKTDNMPEISNIFYEMLYQEHPKQQIDLFFDSCLYRLLSYSATGHLGKPVSVPIRKSSADMHIERALAYIKNNHKEKSFQIESIGPAIGLNDMYFRKLFKQQLGISPKQYLIKYRIEAATTLLHTSNYSIAEIATMVGFHDYRHFLEIFRKHTGQIPGALRANNTSIQDTKSHIQNE